MGIRSAFKPVEARVWMSASVKKVDQWVFSAAAEPGRESNVYWSTADEKAPLKASEFIHFSRTSQPPKLTPRRKVVEVFAGAEGAGVEIEEVMDEAAAEEGVAVVEG